VGWLEECGRKTDMGKLWRVRGIGVFTPARPMIQQITDILDVFRLAPSRHIIHHQKLQIRCPPSYIISLDMNPRFWAPRGQHMQLNGRLSCAEPSPDSHREAIACGNINVRMYASYSYGYITRSVFEAGR
jgi:hypothetical protein